MEVIADKSFQRDFVKLPDEVKVKITQLYDVLSDLTLQEVLSLPQVEFITSAKNFYRYRIEDYRLGFYITHHKLHLSRALHQKDMYRYFPPR